MVPTEANWAHQSRSRGRFPESIQAGFEEHLRRVKAIHERDLRDGWGEAPLPYALARKYPGAARE